MSTYLSAELAQRVVEQLETTLEGNLNVMDASGVIVASGDARRVGQFHPGAREAAERGTGVEVREETARAGERAGVNLPIRHRGGIIGVVGLTGDPDRLRPIAAVVVLTIELLIDRELELGQLARRDAQDRELLSRLVFAASSPLAMAALARRHADIPAPWVLHAVLPAAADGAGFDPRMITQLRAGAGGRPAVVAVLRGSLWILASTPAGPAGGRRLPEPDALHERLGEGVRLLSSLRCDTPAEVLQETARLALLAARPGLLPAAGAQLDTAALGPETAAAVLPAPVAAAVRGHLAGLRAADLETLAAFLDSGSVGAAAARAFAHRNTVLQRLARVQRISGLDPRTPRDAATLRLALVLQRERDVPVHDALPASTDPPEE